MAISGTNFTIKNTIIDAFTSGGFPFNTDGFDIKLVDHTDRLESARADRSN
jgi:hypothetical protein